jgi:predicted nuclease of predicted toxin-antitoxin system
LIVLADENLHRGIAHRLLEAGHVVEHIGDLAPSVTDDQVLAMAVARRALLITNDTDFGELVFTRGARHAGVLLLRLDDLPFDEQAELVVRTLAVHGVSLSGAFAVLSRRRLRIRG